MLLFSRCRDPEHPRNGCRYWLDTERPMPNRHSNDIFDHSVVGFRQVFLFGWSRSVTFSISNVSRCLDTCCICASRCKPIRQVVSTCVSKLNEPYLYTFIYLTEAQRSSDTIAVTHSVISQHVHSIQQWFDHSIVVTGCNGTPTCGTIWWAAVPTSPRRPFRPNCNRNLAPSALPIRKSRYGNNSGSSSTRTFVTLRDSRVDGFALSYLAPEVLLRCWYLLIPRSTYKFFPWCI
jgi:hypothetical protein